ESSLIDVLWRRASSQGEEEAYVFLADGEEVGERLTYGELGSRVRGVAEALSALSGAGERALLLYPPGLEFAVGFLACLASGVVAVPAYPPASRRHLPRLASMVEDARPALVLSSSSLGSKLHRSLSALPSLGGARWLLTDEIGGSPGWSGRRPSRSDLAFLQYTSGSTSSPKGVMVSHGNLLANEALIQRAFGLDGSAVVVGWLPLYHDMGLIGNLLQPLYLGGRCVLMSPVSFLQRPVRWLRAISRFGGTVSGGPNFAYELCVRKVGEEDRSGLDLSSWRLAFSGAEPVRAATLDRFASAFSGCGFRYRSFYPCYGLAESTLMVSGGDAESPPVVVEVEASALARDEVREAAGSGRALVGCGRAGSGLEVAIVDASTGVRLGEDRVGEIWVSGSSVAQGYWRRASATARDFGARPAGEGDSVRYLRTGDLGFVRGGELFVTGRLKDLIIIRGRNHYPQDLEASAEASHPSLRPGCGAAVSVEVAGEE
ncbi:MAG: fatty acyl-AMP ligase, partial [Planctomycetota bacterium]